MGTALSRRHRRAVRAVSLLGLVAALAVGLGSPFSARAADWAPPRTVFVPATGHTSDGLFLNLWRERPALLGNPITEEFKTQTGYAKTANHQHVVQYYQNVALVYLPDESAGQQVQLLDLGRQALGRLQETATLELALRSASCPASLGDGCVASEATKHTVRDRFLAFWQAAGETQWLGEALTEAFRAPDGSYLQYFERGALRLDRSGDVAPLPLGTLAASRQKLDTKAIAQPADIPVYDEALFVAPPAPEPDAEADLSVQPDAPQAVDAGWSVGTFGPGPQVGAAKEIVVSLSSEAMWAYENGELVESSYVSTGTGEYWETTTPVGVHSILSKFDVQTMTGTIRGVPYDVPDVPYVMYFDDLGNALHGTYWHNNFGTPMSHGCVNLPMDVAAWMYGWAPVGTPVTVLP